MTRVGSVHFVTYASQNFRRTHELLARSALEPGKVDHVHLFGPEDIKSTRFYEMHRAILEAPTGAGYWLWKPYVILQQLGRIRDGDFVLYCDCGRGDGQRVRRPIGPLIEWAMNAGSGVMPGISIPQHGKNAQWTKRDCFVYMGCDSDRFWDSPQIQATVSLWQKNSFAADFVATWLDYCCDPRILTDQPNTCGKDNLPGFIEHRRDCDKAGCD